MTGIPALKRTENDMRFWILAACGTLVLFGRAAPAAEQSEGVAKWLAAMQQVKREGQGNQAAAQAWSELTASADAYQLPAILAGLDDADPLAANWIRAAVDAIAERHVNNGDKLPTDGLEKFLSEKHHNPRARRLAYEWIARVDPAWSGKCAKTECEVRGEHRCEGNELRRCRQDLTGWDVVDTCATPEVCLAGVDLANKTEGVVDMCPAGCLSAGMTVCEGQYLRRCKDDLTGYDTAMEPCPEGTDCNPVEGACTAPCTEGDVQCNGSQLRRCKADHTWEELAMCASPVQPFFS